MFTASQLARHVSKRDLVAALDVIDAALQVGTEAQFAGLMRLTFNVLPIDRADVGVVDIGADHAIIRNKRLLSVNYPAQWISVYRRRAFHRVDPVSRNLFVERQPMIWSQLRSRTPTPMEKEFYGVAADFGLHDGFGFGERFENSAAGSFFSCAGADLGQSRRHRMLLDYLAPHLHVALSRMHMGQLHGKPQLTRREVEVLSWAKYGKTNWDISKAMGVSARVVKFHLENAIRKLNAANRTQAIAVALSQGLIKWS